MKTNMPITALSFETANDVRGGVPSPVGRGGRKLTEATGVWPEYQSS